MSTTTFQPVTATDGECSMKTRDSYSADDIVLRQLKTASDIASIIHLREEIDLRAHAASGAQFAALEKKETSLDSSVGSK